MVGTKTRFAAEKAPCGKIVDGGHYLDRDDEGLLIRDDLYDCGCRRIRHEFHDGSIEVQTIRHDGRILHDRTEDHGS